MDLVPMRKPSPMKLSLSPKVFSSRREKKDRNLTVLTFLMYMYHIHVRTVSTDIFDCRFLYPLTGKVGGTKSEIGVQEFCAPILINSFIKMKH